MKHTMLQLLLRILDQIGRVKLDFGGGDGDLFPNDSTRRRPSSADPLGGGEGDKVLLGWEAFRFPQALFEVWGPTSGSPWEFYHTVPLFAALSYPEAMKADSSDKTEIFTPTNDKEAFLIAEEAPLLCDEFLNESWGAEWIRQRLMVIVELPGVQSVPAGVRFARAGFQPVCTFDNWPHHKGILRPELILKQLLRYAKTMESLRDGILDEGPPVLLADSERLGHRFPSPNDFDNRYFLDDSILPSLDILRRENIRGIVCLLQDDKATPSRDLCFYFRSLKQLGFSDLYRCDISDPSLDTRLFEDSEISEQFAETRFKFSKANAGGFGLLVPEPSSGGG
jgi:hypothetical protein